MASFEEPVRHLSGKRGYIDLFWKGTLLVEHKSRGQSLDKAYSQAVDYFPGIKERDLPRYVIVSDFARIRLYDLDKANQWEILLTKLPENVELFGFIAGYEKHVFKEQDPVNIRAAEMMGRLHDQLKAMEYQGHPLEVTLVRLLFCLFAEDTGIFDQRSAFRSFIEECTREDGLDLGPMLSQLFEVLNTPVESRPAYLRQEPWDGFPYVNGKLFAERLPPPAFNSQMREALLDASGLDWGKISPSIFGALFQSAMDPGQRRNLGAHYTSEKNIMKAIRPLFLDELRAEFEKVKRSHKLLWAFQKKLANLKFFDPACGCGNFLVIAYRELRLLEIEALRANRKWGARADRYQALDVKHASLCDVDQFYGIEFEEFPAQIAQVAMWLMDHQMNVALSEELGEFFVRVPLVKSANIHHADALELDWRQVADPGGLDFILGNPPFVGSKMLNQQQREQMARLFGHVPGTKVLDYVAGWYLKASDFIQGTRIKCALVSTNSIVQGEQVSILWREMLGRHIAIHFAHRTFRWSNEAKGKAAVDCVIIGFAASEAGTKTIFEYADVRGEPHAVAASNINPYLVDAGDVLVSRRNAPLQDVPRLRFGNMPLDGGHLLLSDCEKDTLLTKRPQAGKFVKRFMGAEEFLNNGSRWCLWLVGTKPEEIRQMPEVLERIEAVRNFRLGSVAPSTRAHALTPALFRDKNHPATDYLIIPKVSSERRRYIPIGYLTPDTVASDLLFIMEGTTLFHFGVLSSSMHMAWVRYVAGRLKSDYRYSKDIVYNNFPWPWQAVNKYRNSISGAAQRVLEARAGFTNASLAALYDPRSMPEPLIKAHLALDKAVDSSYGRPGGFSGDAERMHLLLDLYQILTAPLAHAGKPKRRKKASG